MKYDYTYLAFGGGSQSCGLMVCSNLGLHGVPRADIGLFADTGDESDDTYEAVEKMKKWSDIPIETVSTGHLLGDVIAFKAGERSRVASIPLFTDNGPLPPGKLMRACTQEYKIKPTQERVRALMGYRKGQVIKKQAQCLIGISVEEATRMKPNPQKWITNNFPLVDARLRREHCIEIVKEHLGFEPARSACVYCPFMSDASLADMKKTRPHEFTKACAADNILRHKPGVDSDLYVHRSLVPLSQAVFGDDRQLNMFENECEGMCGV